MINNIPVYEKIYCNSLQKYCDANNFTKYEILDSSLVQFIVSEDDFSRYDQFCYFFEDNKPKFIVRCFLNDEKYETISSNIYDRSFTELQTEIFINMIGYILNKELDFIFEITLNTLKLPNENINLFYNEIKHSNLDIDIKLNLFYQRIVDYELLYDIMKGTCAEYDILKTEKNIYINNNDWIILNEDHEFLTT